MATAIIEINGQVGSVTNLPLGVDVNLNDVGVGASTRLWALLSAPPGSAAWIQNPTTKTPTLKTVDSVGSYRIRLTVNGSVTDIAIAAVRTANLNIRIPATGEEDEYGSTIGWSKAMYDAFVAIDTNSAIGNTLDQAYDEGGAGSGRIIAVDSGPILLNVSGGDSGLSLAATGDLNQEPILETDITAVDVNNQIGVRFALAQDGYTEPISVASQLISALPAGGFTALGVYSYVDILPGNASDSETDLFRAETLDPGVPVSGLMVAYKATSGTLPFNYALLADTGDVLLTSGNVRLLDGYLALSEIASDPVVEVGVGSVYTKDDSGDTELFYKDDSGNVVQITKNGFLNMSALADAYELKKSATDTTPGFLEDKMSPGLNIVFDELNPGGDEKLVVETEEFLALPTQGADPTASTANDGYLYAKTVDGAVELHYIDDAGAITRITNDGYLDTFESLRGVGLFMQPSDPTTAPYKGFLYTKEIASNTELFYKDGDGNVIQITSDGYLGIDGYTVLEQFDELNPATTTGIETSLPLTGTPMVQNNMPSGYALDVFQNGARMRWVAVLGASKTEWTYNATLNRIEFVASGVAGTWYAARYKTDPEIAINSLDQAYNMGRVITADAGAVIINASGNEAIEIDGYLTLDEISNPSNLADAGLVYSREIDGYTELFYMDDYGLATQITNKGSPVGGDGNTLDQAYDEGGAGAGRIITADSGGVIVNAGGDEAIGIDGYLSLAEIAAPTGLPNEGHIYAKDDGGDTELFYQDAAGNEVQITQDGSTLGANTLNQAYDQGGAGAGRVITTDAGAVVMDASGNDALELDGYMLLNEITDPTNVANKGFLYSKNDDAYGTSELFYMDDSGQITQITQDGYLATYNSLRGVSLLEGTEFTDQVGRVSLYAKLSNGITELFTKDSGGNETQVTLGGRLNTTAVTNSGFADAVIEFVPSVAVGLTSTSFVDITGADGYFDAVVAGSYILTFNVQVYQASGVSQRTNFRVIVDKGDYNGFTEQIIEPTDNDAWNIISVTSGEHYSASFTTHMVEMGFGNHKITVQYQNDGGGSGAQINTDDYVNLVAINLAGSGAGGALSDQTMLTVSKNYVSVDTWETVTELNVSFDTVENEEVLLVYSGSISTTSVVNAFTSFAVDGYRYQDGVREGLSQAKDISKSYVTPPLTAGNHTASFQIMKDGAGTLTVDAYGTLQVLQFRGGLVPIQDEGTTIVDIPAAFNFTGRVIVADNNGVADIQIGDLDYIRIEQQVADPSVDPDGYDGYLYGKLMDGYTELFYMDNYGVAVRLTQDGTLVKHALGGIEHTSSTLAELNALVSDATLIDDTLLDSYATTTALTNHTSDMSNPHNVTLQQAYISGNSIIIIPGMPVHIDAYDSYEALNLDGYLGLHYLDGYPDAQFDKGQLFVFDVPGSGLELLYMDHAGVVTQITQGGTLAKHALGGSEHTSSTLAELNALVSDATLIDSTLLDSYATLVDIDPLAEKALLDSYATLVDIDPLAEKTLLDSYATLVDIDPLAEKTLLDSYATLADIDPLAEKTLLDSYATLSVFNNHANDTSNPHNVTLQQAYANGNTIIVWPGVPVHIDAYDSYEALNLDGYLGLHYLDGYPDAQFNKGQLFVYDVPGYGLELLYMDHSGQITQITQGGSLAVTHNTLDQAYDEGGPGAGRLITADAGSVIIDASGDEALEIDGYITLDEISDPVGLDNASLLYSKDVDGYSELHHVDNYDESVQITRRGALYNLLPSYNVAQLPAASPAGQMVFVPDESGGAVPAFSDGTNWRRVTDRAIVS